MSTAGWANIIISITQGLLVAGITLLLGSSLWWLWGCVFAAVTSVSLACVQVASQVDTERNYDDAC